MSDAISFDGVQYISAGEAADRLGLTRDYIARLCRDGKVRGRRIGKNWYADEETLLSFVVNQEYTKTHRRELLTKDRVQEYRGAQIGSAAHAVVPGVSLGLGAIGVVGHADDLRKKITGAIAAHGGKLTARASAFANIPTGLTNAALQGAHVPLYTVTPMMEFLHKLIALALTLMLTFGTYALVDPQYARFAANSISDNVRSIATSLRSRRRSSA